MNWYKSNIKVAGSYSLFHGSPAKFRDFSYEFSGKNGTNEGYGLYFTNNRAVAKSFAIRDGKPEGYIYHCSVSIDNPISNTQITLELEELSNILRQLDPTGDGYMSNLGKSYVEERPSARESGYLITYNDAVLESANMLLNNNSNDVDIISDIINSASGSAEDVNSTMYKLGYDGIIEESPEWVSGDSGSHIVYIPFSNEQITINKVEKVYA